MKKNKRNEAASSHSIRGSMNAALWEKLKSFNDEVWLKNKIIIVKKLTEAWWRSHMKVTESALTQLLAFWTAYLWLAASYLCGVSLLLAPFTAVILTDYFITEKSLLFPQSSAGASGIRHSLLFFILKYFFREITHEVPFKILHIILHHYS